MYIVRKVYNLDYPEHYPFSYWDDIFTAPLFAANSMWLNPAETIPFATILSYVDEAVADDNYDNLAVPNRELKDHLKALDLTDTSLASRVTAVESGLLTKASTSSVTTLASRVTSLETWRAAKAPASPNVSTSYSVATSPISLGTNAPTAAGVNTLINTIMGEVNGIKQILRDREILAA